MPYEIVMTMTPAIVLIAMLVASARVARHLVNRS